MVKPITIIDIIDHRWQNGVQMNVVVDRMPRYVYERQGQLLSGHDSGFFQFYQHERPGPNWEAFAGRKFNIPMADGSVIEASGQWWDLLPSEFSELVYSPGVGSLEKLSRCYVFCGCHIDRELVDAWRASNFPSNNYYRYDKGHADCGKRTIVSRWGES